jgi:signal transduction histidine kinase
MESKHAAMEKTDSGPPLNYESLRHFLHDLAQPLATVTGVVDLLLLELDERDQIFQEIRLISDQLEKILTIIGEIRQIARGAAERETKSQQPSQSVSS